MKLGVESRFYHNPEADVRVTYMQWFGGRGKHLYAPIISFAFKSSNTGNTVIVVSKTA
jgi:hypothetical protein